MNAENILFADRDIKKQHFLNLGMKSHYTILAYMILYFLMANMYRWFTCRLNCGVQLHNYTLFAHELCYTINHLPNVVAVHYNCPFISVSKYKIT